MLSTAMLIAVGAPRGAIGENVQEPCTPANQIHRGSEKPIIELGYPHRPNELLVRPKVGMTPLSPAEFEGFGIRGITNRRDRYSLFEFVGGDSDDLLSDRAKNLMATGRFESLEPNYCVFLDPIQTSMTTSATQSALDKIGARQAWLDATSGDSDVIVAVIDSGIETADPDLAPSQLWTNDCEENNKNGLDDACDGNDLSDDINGWNFAADSPQLEDESGHGTQVASIIGAVHENGICGDGINKNVGLMILKVTAPDGSSDVDDVISAINYAKEAGADVINLSWSTYYSYSLMDALSMADEAGALVVAAAGHNGSAVNLENNPSFPCSFKLANVICVTGSTDTDEIESTLSCWGKDTVHLGAPGKSILSAAKGASCALGSGPSMAAPHVAGVAALIRAMCPCETVDQMIARIKDGADPNLPPTSVIATDTIWKKRLNALGALQKPCGTVCPTPP